MPPHVVSVKTITKITSVWKQFEIHEKSKLQVQEFFWGGGRKKLKFKHYKFRKLQWHIVFQQTSNSIYSWHGCGKTKNTCTHLTWIWSPPFTGRCGSTGWRTTVFRTFRDMPTQQWCDILIHQFHKECYDNLNHTMSSFTNTLVTPLRTSLPNMF